MILLNFLAALFKNLDCKKVRKLLFHLRNVPFRKRCWRVDRTIEKIESTQFTGSEHLTL